MLSSCLHKWLAKCQSNQLLPQYESSAESNIIKFSAPLCTFPYSLEGAMSNMIHLDLSNEFFSLLAGESASLSDYSNLIVR